MKIILDVSVDAANIYITPKSGPYHVADTLIVDYRLSKGMINLCFNANIR